jgi:hypothetical protein
MCYPEFKRGKAAARSTAALRGLPVYLYSTCSRDITGRLPPWNDAHMNYPVGSVFACTEI